MDVSTIFHGIEFTSMETSMEVGGSRFTSMEFPWKLVEMDSLPWKLVEASMKMHGSFHCRWKYKLPLLPSIAASTNIFRGSFHELPYIPTYILPLTCTSITNFQLLLKDLRKLPPTSVRSTVLARKFPQNFPGISTEVILLPWKLLCFHTSFGGIGYTSMEISMETGGNTLIPMDVSGSFHGSTWKFPQSVEVEASIASTNIFRGSFHLYTASYFHEYHKLPAASTRLTLTLTLIWSYLQEAGVLPTSLGAHESTWKKVVVSMEAGATCMKAGLLPTCMEVGRSFHGIRWK